MDLAHLRDLFSGRSPEEFLLCKREMQVANACNGLIEASKSTV